MTYKKVLALFVLTVALAAFSGCAFTNETVDLLYKPVGTNKNPLSGIRPVKVSLRTEDKRPQNVSDRIGNKMNNLGMVCAKIMSKRPPTEIISQILTEELSRNNHQVVLGDESDYEVLIKVELKKIWAEPQVHFWDVEMNGMIDTHVTISQENANVASTSKPINVTSRTSCLVGDGPAYQKVFNLALKEYVRAFSFDADVLEAMKRAPEKGTRSSTLLSSERQ